MRGKRRKRRTTRTRTRTGLSSQLSTQRRELEVWMSGEGLKGLPELRALGLGAVKTTIKEFHIHNYSDVKIYKSPPMLMVDI